MIVILSTTEFEYSTDEIVQWLQHYNANYVRLNGEDIENNPFAITLDRNKFLRDFGLADEERLTIFNRRWTRYSYIDNLLLNEDEIGLANQVKLLLKMEFATTSKYVFSLLDSPNTLWIDSYENNKINKLNVLRIAQKVGLNVPNTIITNCKKDLLEFRSNNRRIITKTIGELIALEGSSKMFSIGTKEIDYGFIESIKDNFYLSLFQELIEKKYEVRTFYLEGEFFSMAIFSQRREESKIDFRNYDLNDPDRMVPINLPIEIMQKLKTLMGVLELKTGSIDLIVTPQNNYIFLEVNPVGQFGMVSKPCNFRLEKKIAEYLIKKDNQK